MAFSDDSPAPKRPRWSQEPTLYILMRDDLDSLNAGKAMAQAAHASSMLSAWMEEDIANRKSKDDYKATDLDQAYMNWKHFALRDLGFGRTVVLAGSGGHIERSINKIEDAKYSNVPIAMTDLVIDPTYPIKDGSEVHLVNLLTCGWVFVAGGLYTKAACSEPGSIVYTPSEREWPNIIAEELGSFVLHP